MGCCARNYYKPTGRRLLRRPRQRREDNIIMNLKEIDVNVRSWFDSSRDRGPWKYFVNEALNIRVP